MWLGCVWVQNGYLRVMLGAHPKHHSKKAFSLYIFYLIYLLLLQATSDRGGIRRHFFGAVATLRSYMAYNVFKINLRPYRY